MRLSDEIASHYAQGVERDRLTTWGRLEALRTRELLARFLPPAPAVVLDVGGAEGAYALPLAQAGYAVHLLDPVPAHVEAARAASARQATAPLAGAEVGDARELPFGDGTADAVLLLGPLYHLIEADDRTRALAEAHRVLRPGGQLLAAAISRFASTLDGLRSGMITDPTFEAIVENDLHTGTHHNPDVEGRPEWFTLAYFHHPDELLTEVRHSGFPDAEVLAVEGPCGQATMTIDLDNPTARDTALRAIARVEREPSLLGASPHLMAVATKL
ncbi:methyltransferase family protein [Herbihabitans rhizosphaerae]|uniref:Methyltransferase family protein n=1 Tax=Herbihabitans rhizosphaerae TaxID=1872711 RepID=A0A4Q7KQI2_9PSEU|nr:class I SAM-dependent methyltransferase [Herbihabitans rhizosphaerae]RZS37572.1 methyltransferase family protein [Herbihabitans rhizosphaerae]